jgi:hypothetical protein
MYYLRLLILFAHPSRAHPAGGVAGGSSRIAKRVHSASIPLLHDFWLWYLEEILPTGLPQ